MTVAVETMVAVEMTVALGNLLLYVKFMIIEWKEHQLQCLSVVLSPERDKGRERGEGRIHPKT